MGPDAIFTLAVLAGVIVLLVVTRWPPSLVLLAGLTTLLATGIVSEADALEGFANPAVIVIAALFAVTAGLKEPGAMAMVTEPLLGRPKTLAVAPARLMGPTAVLSAFVSNTPLVAAMLPVVHDWASKHGYSVSKLLIPLSFASILGGACTLIGTTTMLVVDGLIIEEFGMEAGIGMFEIAVVSLPCAVVGLVYLLIFGRWILPDRRPVISREDDARQYTVEMLVDEGSPLTGKTIEQAGLRHLPGLYLMEIEREDQVMAAPSPNVQLRSHDRLVFAGVVESVVDLQKIRGLTPATDQAFMLDKRRANRRLVEAVVSESNPLIRRTIREGRFRTRYNAAVIAVARHGERLNQKIGDIVLRAGDTLLLEARGTFTEQQRNSRDFYLVSQVSESAAPRHNRAWLAIAILVAMVAVMTVFSDHLVTVALGAALLMILSRCCTTSIALRAIDWHVLIVIGAAVGIGEAMINTGAADAVANSLIGLAGDDPAQNKTLVLGLLIGVTMLFTNVINAKAAAVLMFPIACDMAGDMGVSVMPLAIGMMIGAAASFVTPIGYQTNLMVYGPGGYRFGDYARVGLPLSVLVLITATLVIPHFWAWGP